MYREIGTVICLAEGNTDIICWECNFNKITVGNVCFAYHMKTCVFKSR